MIRMLSALTKCAVTLQSDLSFQLFHSCKQGFLLYKLMGKAMRTSLPGDTYKTVRQFVWETAKPVSHFKVDRETLFKKKYNKSITD